MLKKFVLILLGLCLILGLMACKSDVATKTVHCDACGKAVEIEADSNMEEDWINYCAACNEELFGDDPILGG